jgi:hypothetical protein
VRSSGRFKLCEYFYIGLLFSKGVTALIKAIRLSDTITSVNLNRNSLCGKALEVVALEGFLNDGKVAEKLTKVNYTGPKEHKLLKVGLFYNQWTQSAAELHMELKTKYMLRKLCNRCRLGSAKLLPTTVW